MSTLVIYMSNHGCAEKAAFLLRKHLADPDTVLIDLRKDRNVDLSRFDTIIIGGSIYLGSLQKGLKKFCDRNMPGLIARRIGLYICSMNRGDAARAHFDAVFDPGLRAVSVADGLFGGEIDFKNLNAMEKALIGRVAAI